MSNTDPTKYLGRTQVLVKGNEQHGPNQIPGTNPGAREG